MVKMDAPKRFIKDESGLETVEWAFVLGLVVLNAVVALAGAGTHMLSIFDELINQLSTAAGQVSVGS